MTTDPAGAAGPEHDFALICGEGDEPYVREVFAMLKKRRLRVFYPAHEEFAVQLWGQHLLEALDRVIRGQARFVVVFVSRHLDEAVARFQRRSAVVGMMEAAGVFLLPVRMDDAELPGLPLTGVGTMDGRRTTARELARMLEQKLREGGAAGHRAPVVDVRVDRDAGRPPRAVVIRNSGAVAISGCVYVAQLADPLGLRAWFLSPPADLAPGAEVEHVFGAPQGVELAKYLRNDTEVDSFLRTQRLTVLVTVRAFESEAAATWERHKAPERIGHFPPASLFGPLEQDEGGNVDAVVFGTEGGRLHRLLAHLSTPMETLEPDLARPVWAAWYEETGLRPLRPPPEISGPLPLPLMVGRQLFRR